MRKPTLLYAEDDTESRENYTFVLQKYFSEVYGAENGKEALILYNEKKPDVLLLDISMPYVDGLEVAKTVRREDKETPIVMLTAHSDREKLLRAIPLGLFEYLIKPVDGKILVDTMLKAIVRLQGEDLLSLSGGCMWSSKNSTLLCNNEPIALTKKETILMELLAVSPDRYISKEFLIAEIWDETFYDETYENKLIQVVYRLNKKIKSVVPGKKHFVENSYDRGYKIASS